MNQEELPGNDFSGNDLKAENTRKILVIAILAGLFCGFYYYYYYFVKNDNHKKNIAVSNIQQPRKLPAVKTVSPVQAGTAIASKAVVDKYSLKKPAIPVNDNSNNSVKAADKAGILKLAMIPAGKADPFSDSTTNTTNQHSGTILFHRRGAGQGYLPFPPVLPPVPTGTLPSISIPGGDLPIPGQVPAYSIPGQIPDNITIKGFIGDKVIAGIGGTTEAWKANDSFQGVKVLSVDPGGLTAKFEKDGKIITKKIESSTGPENSSELKPGNINN